MQRRKAALFDWITHATEDFQIWAATRRLLRCKGQVSVDLVAQHVWTERLWLAAALGVLPLSIHGAAWAVLYVCRVGRCTANLSQACEVPSIQGTPTAGLRAT